MGLRGRFAVIVFSAPARHGGDRVRHLGPQDRDRNRVHGRGAVDIGYGELKDQVFIGVDHGRGKAGVLGIGVRKRDHRAARLGPAIPDRAFRIGAGSRQDDQGVLFDCLVGARIGHRRHIGQVGNGNRHRVSSRGAAAVGYGELKNQVFVRVDLRRRKAGILRIGARKRHRGAARLGPTVIHRAFRVGAGPRQGDRRVLINRLVQTRVCRWRRVRSRRFAAGQRQGRHQRQKSKQLYHSPYLLFPVRVDALNRMHRSGWCLTLVPGLLACVPHVRGAATAKRGRFPARRFPRQCRRFPQGA